MDPKLEHEAITAWQSLIERTLIAATVGFATVLIAQWLLHVDPPGAKEVAMLNAGLAFYTHEATGNIIAAVGALVSMTVGVILKRLPRYRKRRES